MIAALRTSDGGFLYKHKKAACEKLTGGYDIWSG